MTHAYAEEDDVHHQVQGPHRERPKVEQANLYTIIRRMPVEADGRHRYRIKSKTGNVERIATEDELSRCP
jgi:hypothetical protein